MLNIDQMILQAMKNKCNEEVRTYRSLKAEVQNIKTAKGSKPYDEAAEIRVIEKMVNQRKDSIDQYSQAGREDLVISESAELEILLKLLPAPVSAAEIEDWLDDYCVENLYYVIQNGEVINTIPKKEMGNVIKLIKAALPGASTQEIAAKVKECIKQ